MNERFHRDDHPGAPRVLFVGWPDSTHTHSWIDLVRDRCNVRLYSLPRGFPPDHWPVRTHVTQSTPRKFDPANRRKLYPGGSIDRDVRNWFVRRVHGVDAPRLGLAQVIRSWRPHVVHALGLDEAGWFVRQVREHFGLLDAATWVLQLRGGSDMALRQHDPAQRGDLAATLGSFDLLLTDNRRNIEIAGELDIPRSRFASFVPVPGTGGMDVADMERFHSGPPSGRKDILWPKAYECQWSKSTPVLEALRLIGDGLHGHRVHLLATDPETRAWCGALPESVRRSCVIRERIPREEALALMGNCRIMLAPSLVDGVPNSLYEAMALGALPVVSPIETIRTVVSEPDNVLFARNLHPAEIAAAVQRALCGDALVDDMAARNRSLVKRLADREVIREKVGALYRELAKAR